jgi:hypothetical protein
MANSVFANGREIACKAGAGKTICAFPDVCFTPPENPATPPGVPIPYPNTGMASDTTDGSKKVKISDKEVMLKNKSCFKKSMGDEAGAAAKKGVITSKNTGKVYFNAWSMDVKIEGQNVDRHLDLTTNNHASMPGDTPTWPYLDTMSMSDPEHPCVEDQMKEMEACQDYKPHGDKDPCEGISSPPSPPSVPDGMLKKDFLKSTEYNDYKSMRHAFYAEAAHDSAQHECLNARRCQLVPYKPTTKQPGCCNSKRQTGHHIVEASACFDKGRGGSDSTSLKGCGKYKEGKAPSICAEGTDHGTGTHGLMHTFQSDSALTSSSGSIPLEGGGSVDAPHVTTYEKARDNGVAAVSEVFPEAGCNEECLKAQMDAYHKDECEMKDDTELKAVATTTSPDV